MLDATGGARTPTAISTGESAPGGHPGARGDTHSPTERANVTSPCPLQVVLPSARQLPRAIATAGAASRAASSAQPAAGMLPGARGGGRRGSSAAGTGRRGAGAPRAVAVRLGLGTDCERSARRGSSRCRRDFPLARDAEQRAVLATAKHLRNRCRSSSWQPRLAVTKAGLGWRNRPALGATGGGDFLQPQHT